VYWRREYLRKAASLAVGGTWREDLPDHGQLGGILMHIYGGAVNSSMIALKKWRLIDYIDSIEIIGDGSEVIKSYTGQLAKYINWLDGGIAYPDKHFNYGTSTRRFHFFIPFGRKMFDPSLGLDLDKWSNVEISVKNDAAAAQFTTAPSIDAMMYFLEGAPGAFPGYLRTEEWRKYTTASAEIKYLELPTQHKIRRIIFQVWPAWDTDDYLANTTPYSLLYNIELNFKTGMLKVWDGNLRDLWYENAFDIGRDVLQGAESVHTQDYGIWNGLGQTLAFGGLRTPHDGTQDTATPSLSPGEDSSTQSRMTDTDADTDSLMFLGLALENCAHFRFDRDENPLSWLDPKAMDTVQLNLQTGSGASYTGGIIRVILDRYVPR